MSKNPGNPQKLGKVYKFMERFWLIAAIVSTGLTSYILIQDGFEAGRYYIILPGIAIVIWFMRRRLRKSYERMQEANKEEQ